MAKGPRTPPPPEHEKKPDPATMTDPDNALTVREKRTMARLRHIDGIRKAMSARLAAAEVLKAARKGEVKLRRAYELDGFSLKLLDEAFDRENTPGRDLQAYEQERVELFEDMGQRVYVEQDLIERMPEAAFDEQVWADAGYSAGLAGREGKPPKECPPTFVQAWMKRWGAGQERLAWALSERGINPERGTVQPGTPGAVVDHNPEDDKDAERVVREQLEQVDDDAEEIFAGGGDSFDDETKH